MASSALHAFRISLQTGVDSISTDEASSPQCSPNKTTLLSEASSPQCSPNKTALLSEASSPQCSPNKTTLLSEMRYGDVTVETMS